MNNFPAEAKFIHGSGVEVFNENISLLNKFGKNLLTVGCLSIEGKRLLVGVELKIIVTGEIGIELKFFTGGIAYTGTFDFNYICAKPGEHLGT